MKASRLVELLQKTIENHGDLDVLAYNRTEEADGRVRKVQVKTFEAETEGEDAGMPYYCANGSVLDSLVENGEDLVGREYVVLYND